ncbi:methionyl-tRNA formyltransferase, mitochondrial [Phlebotomus argentipes]|uniref:methionyl-tRNA formyltransferase, mitochondrial n=1 Tax=Phlebotomus argentipes TaxID=94469 RepID=UPI002892C74E|nr:methionyl-tRNA formyltransferase, mitochondrial [Phlebotomus argentipes]
MIFRLSRRFSTLNYNQLRVLFFGSDKFSLASLRLITEEYKRKSFVQKLCVVTQVKLQANPVRNFAERENLEVFPWPVNEQEISGQFDIGVVVSFGHLLGTSLIKSFPLGMINVHGSLLPRWRGAAPIIHALMAGDTETGVSIMMIKPKHFDIGEILAQRRVSVESDVLMPQLHACLANVGGSLLLDCLQDLETSLNNAKPQSLEGVTYAPKVDKKPETVRWSDLTSTDIFNLYRAFFSFKHLMTNWQGIPIKLLSVSVREIKSPDQLSALKDKPSGSFIYHKQEKCLIVKCSQQTYLNVLSVGIEGKRAMSALDFCNGFTRKRSKSQETNSFH